MKTTQFTAAPKWRVLTTIKPTGRETYQLFSPSGAVIARASNGADMPLREIATAVNSRAALRKVAALAVQAAELGFSCPEVNEQLAREAKVAYTIGA